MVTQQTTLPARFQSASLTRAAEDEVEIHRNDAATVALFFALDTQWRRHPFTGQRVGLDYAAIKPTADLAGIEVSADTLPGLRVMEHAAMTAFAEASK